jgi:Sulfotransferase family
MLNEVNTVNSAIHSRRLIARQEGPVFIVGMWRSGASLLYALLNKHPKVELMFEADLHLIRTAFWNPWHGDLAARWQFWNLALSRHGIHSDDLGNGQRTFGGVFSDVHRRFAARKGATIWGDKSPNYYDRMAALSKEFWNAKFVIVWRDPIGTANAISRAAKADAAFFKKRGIQLRALLGYRILQRQCNQLLAEGRDICQINYEDLTREPEVAMRKVCEFLQIPFIAEIATLKNADRSSVPIGAHHAVLHGETILDGERPNIVDPALRDKIVRYKNWWNMEGDQVSRAIAGEPYTRFAERFFDGIRYRGLRTFDAFTRLGFSLLPLSCLVHYRKFRLRNRPKSKDFESQSKKSGFVYES